MCWKLCFPLRSTNPHIKLINKVCICIPIEVPPKPPKGGPPWITKGIIDEKLARDLPVLATIDALASRLSDATVRRTVQRAVQGAVDQKLLPESMGIEFK